MKYLFKHILLREAAYEMQLYRYRREYHLKAAQAIESLYAADLTDYYHDLAYHYGAAQATAQEGYYSFKAGEQAFRQSSYLQARDYFNRASILTPVEEYHYLELQIRLASVEFFLGNYAQSQQIFKHLEQTVPNTPQRAIILSWLSALSMHYGDYAEAEVYLQEGLGLAQEDEEITANINFRWAWLAYYRGNYQASRVYAQASATWYRQHDHLSYLSGVLNIGGISTLLAGTEHESKEMLEESLALAYTLGHRTGQARSLNNLGELARHYGQFEQAIAYYQQSITIYTDIGNPAAIVLSDLNLAHAYLGMGQIEQSRYYLKQVLTAAPHLRGIPLILESLAVLAEIKQLMQQPIEATKILGLIHHHPAFNSEAQRATKRVLQELQQVLSPNEFEANFQRGATLDLDTVIRAFTEIPD